MLRLSSGRAEEVRTSIRTSKLKEVKDWPVYHGKPFNAAINGHELTGKMFVDTNGESYLCHNNKKFKSFHIGDLLGYNYAMCITLIKPNFTKFEIVGENMLEYVK